jgi:hypothetical protein
LCVHTYVCMQSIYCTVVQSFDIKKLAIELGTGRVDAQYSQKNISILHLRGNFHIFAAKMFICANKEQMLTTEKK